MNFYNKFFVFLFIYMELLTNGLCNDNELDTQLNFPHYAYKRSSKFEHKFQNVHGRCESSFECSKYVSFHLQNCVLKCISKRCFEEIYLFDPLEDGELDQRLNSFKGCYSEESK